MDKKAFIIIFLIVVTDIIGFGIFIPLMPVISDTFSTYGFKLGLLMSSYSIAQYVAAPLLGSMSDKYGRRPVLLISKLGTIFAYLIFAFSRSYYLLLFSRLVDGFTGGNISAARAYISDITDAKSRPKGMALIGIAFGLGFIIGPAFGGFFFSLGNQLRYPALAAAGLSLISFVLTWFFLHEPIKTTTTAAVFRLPRLTDLLKKDPISRIMLVQLLYMICLSGFQSTFSIFTAKILGYSVEQNSSLFIYMGIITLAIQGFIAKKGGHRVNYLSGIGLILAATGLSLLVVAQNFYFVLISLGLTLTGAGMVNVFLPSVLLNSASSSEGRLMGTYEGFSSLARIIGPIVAGTLILTIPKPVYLLSALILFLSVKLVPHRALTRQTLKP